VLALPADYLPVLDSRTDQGHLKEWSELYDVNYSELYQLEDSGCLGTFSVFNRRYWT
jgi:hypothetical protein